MPTPTRPSYAQVYTALETYTALLDRVAVPEGAAVWTCNQIAVQYDLDGIVVNDRDDPPEQIARRHAVAAASALNRLRRSDPAAAEETLLSVLRALLPAS